MARGATDYGVPDYSFFAVETPVSDVVAERLGFSRLDNRGRIFLIEDWRESYYRWQITSDGGGSDPVHKISNTQNVSLHGYVSLDPVIENGTSEISTNLVLPVSKRLGVEVNFLPVVFPSTLSIFLSHAYDDSHAYLSNILLLSSTMHVLLVDPNGSQTIISSNLASKIANYATSIKFVIDVSTGRYVRLLLGNTQYDLSSYSVPTTVSGLSGATQITVRSVGGVAPNISAYNINYIVLSGDEP